ncbi:MAG: PhzF family phenazine biosynthesis protein [Gammaproteobacteria bacterium]|nr:PhzF family phenazine biosynthesis protein [Gammaproteobacteria bacterium]
MKLPIYQIDAFAEKTFEGNPAAVIPLHQWLDDDVMQAIAAENNLAETAFFVPVNDGFHIRWFTPDKEVKLCGHATLASAFVLFNLLAFDEETIKFDSLSGPLFVTQNGHFLTLDFPSQVPQPCDLPEDLVKGLGKRPVECLSNEDFILVFENDSDVASIIPNHEHLKKVALRGVIVTAPSKDYDFVARVFAPKYGIAEDPVTGSAYTQLMPYWSKRLGMSKLKARQISLRGGNVFCELKTDRVLISGSAVKYLEGMIEI